MVFWELQARCSSDQRFLHNEGLCCLGYRCCITERVFEIFPRNCSYSNIPSPRLSLTGQIWVPEATGELRDIFSKALMCISTRARRTEAGFDQTASPDNCWKLNSRIDPVSGDSGTTLVYQEGRLITTPIPIRRKCVEYSGKTYLVLAGFRGRLSSGISKRPTSSLCRL
jgi:hypothetical protein